MKLNVISGQRFGRVPQGCKLQSIISVAGHQVIRNLSEPSEFTLMHLDTYADYLMQVEPSTESRAVLALLTTGGPRIKNFHGRYVEVYGPYQVMLNVDGISIYTRTYVTTDNDQTGQIYLGEEELKVRRIGHDAMMEKDAVHIGYEADVTAHLLDTNGKKIGVTGLLDTGYYKKNYGKFNNGPANQGNNWYKPRDDMDKRRSCENCSSTDNHVSACPTYKQGMKSLGFSLEDEDASEIDHEDFMRGVIAKFGPRCFFCNLEGHFK